MFNFQTLKFLIDRNENREIFVMCLCIGVCEDLLLLGPNSVIRMLGINDILIILSHTKKIFTLLIIRFMVIKQNAFTMLQSVTDKIKADKLNLGIP